jgi:hypothetical protein
MQVVGVLKPHSCEVKLAGVMLALTIRKEVQDYLDEASRARPPRQALLDMA